MKQLDDHLDLAVDERRPRVSQAYESTGSADVGLVSAKMVYSLSVRVRTATRPPPFLDSRQDSATIYGCRKDRAYKRGSVDPIDWTLVDEGGMSKLLQLNFGHDSRQREASKPRRNNRQKSKCGQEVSLSPPRECKDGPGP